MAVASEEKIKFNSAGPAGPARFEEGVAGYEARAFRGLGVFTSVPFDVSEDADSVQMLQRSTQVGEFYIMAPPKVIPADDLPKEYMDIVIYDEEQDKHVHITFAEALAAAMPDGVRAGPLAKSDNKYTAFPFFGSGGATGTVDAIVGSVTTPSRNPFNGAIVIARPFIEHLMMSAVMAVAGRDTGATLFGPADMQISANTSVKTIEGHYTYANATHLNSTHPPHPLLTLRGVPPSQSKRCHTKSVITKPQNVLVLRDIMCAGYVAGGNTLFFGEKAKAKAKANGKDDKYESEKIKESMRARLEFEDDASGEYESMLAFAVPVDWGSKRDQVCSLSPRLLPWEVTANEKHGYFPGGQQHFEYYSDVFGLNEIHYGEDIRAAESQEFIAQGSTNNSLCFIGPHRVYSPWSSSFFELTPGQGHFGPDAIPGVRASLRSNHVVRCVRNLKPVACLRVAGRALAPRRGGVARERAQRDGIAGGGGALAAGVPEALVERRRGARTTHGAGRRGRRVGEHNRMCDGVAGVTA